MSHFAISSLAHFRFARRSLPWPVAVCVMLVMAALPVVATGPADRPAGTLPGTQTGGTSHSRSGATANYTWQIVTTAEGRTLIASDPTNPVNYIRASMAAYHHGDLATAVKLLEDGRRNATPSALLLLALGALYAELDRLPAAESATRSALELEPDNLDAQVQLGEISASAGMHHNAITAFRSALAADEDQPAAQSGLVFSLLAVGQVQEAEQACRLFLTSRVDRAELWLALGEALEQQERLRDAFASYGQAIAFDPELGAAHCRRGRLFCRFGQFEAAATECRLALALDPADPLAHAYLGIACSRLGLLDEAREHSQLAEKAGLQMDAVWAVVER